MNFLITLILLSSIFLYSCANQVDKVYFPYSIDSPDQQVQLPEKLDEISGLSYFKNEKIYCVQDEDDIIFLYDFKNDGIIKKFDFAKDNDYEGITLVEDVIYVLKSNGTLYRIENFKNDKEIEVEKITTDLKPKNDTEGLVYDKKGNQLLIVCKGETLNKDKGKKAIYAFNLRTKELDKEPFLLIDIEEIRSHKRIGINQQIYEDFLSGLGNENAVFAPSGIAIHPLTKNIYVLSSVGRTLLVVSRKGELIYTVPLLHSNFRQPEGITFAPDGTLFISNEGKKGHANIQKFSYKPKDQNQ